MNRDELIAKAIEAGFIPYYGCKTRHDIENDDCPCDKNGNCTQKELAGFKLPIENVEIVAKFAALIAEPLEAEIARLKKAYSQ